MIAKFRETWQSDVEEHGERRGDEEEMWGRGDKEPGEAPRQVSARGLRRERWRGRHRATGVGGVGDQTRGGKLGRRRMEKEKDETVRGEKKERKGGRIQRKREAMGEKKIEETHRSQSRSRTWELGKLT